MTRNGSFFLFLFFPIFCFSQNIPFPVNDAVWREVEITIGGSISRHFALCGDTLLGGNAYSQIRSLEVDDNLNIVSSTFVGGLRQINGRVYFYADFLGNDLLLYDFALETGEEISLTLPFMNEQVTRKVDSTKVEMLAGAMRKVIYFEKTDPDCFFLPEQWIEGIGSSYGLLARAFDPCLLADAGNQLLCFQQEEDYLNLTLIECFLPELNNCTLVNAATAIDASVPALKIFPNPTNQNVFLEQPGQSMPADCRVRVVNTVGEPLVIKQHHQDGRISLAVESLPAGIYFVQLTDAQNRLIGFGKFSKI